MRLLRFFRILRHPTVHLQNAGLKRSLLGKQKTFTRRMHALGM